MTGVGPNSFLSDACERALCLDFGISRQVFVRLYYYYYYPRTTTTATRCQENYYYYFEISRHVFVRARVRVRCMRVRVCRWCILIYERDLRGSRVLAAAVD